MQIWAIFTKKIECSLAEKCFYYVNILNKRKNKESSLDPIISHLSLKLY